MSQKVFLHGNFESQQDWAALVPEWKIFPLWEFLSENTFSDWPSFIGELKHELMASNVQELAGYSMGGRILLGLMDLGLKVEKASFFSAHPGLKTEEEKSQRIWNDLKWKEKTLLMDWNDLFSEWNAEAIFAGSTKPYATFEPLIKYRREIAHAFDILGLGRMPDFSGIKFPQTTQVSWVCGQHDHKFRALGEAFCKKHPRVNYLVAFNQSHRMSDFIRNLLLKGSG